MYEMESECGIGGDAGGGAGRRGGRGGEGRGPCGGGRERAGRLGGERAADGGRGDDGAPVDADGGGVPRAVLSGVQRGHGGDRPGAGGFETRREAARHRAGLRRDRSGQYARARRSGGGREWPLHVALVERVGGEGRVVGHAGRGGFPECGPREGRGDFLRDEPPRVHGVRRDGAQSPRARLPLGGPGASAPRDDHGE